MATDVVTAGLKAQFDRLSKTNFDTALKKNLGEMSIYERFKSRIDDLINRSSSILTIAPTLSDALVSELSNPIVGLNNILTTITGTQSEVFVQQRQTFINQIEALLDQAFRFMIPFVVYAQENFLSANVKGKAASDINQLREVMQKQANEAIAHLKLQTEVILEQAKERAKNIQATARDTAAGVSVIGANAKFDSLIRQFKTGMVASGAASVVIFIVFFSYIYHLLDNVPDVSNTAHAIFSTSIRVIMLGSLAAIGAFLLKIFRANLHMYYHTLHRQQLTNTIEVFVESARTDAQRDVILSKLIETVSEFGSSGLIGGSDDIPSVAKIIIENIPKLFPGKGSG